jgi:ABC-type lipoprotein export system ATPase subunit
MKVETMPKIAPEQGKEIVASVSNLHIVRNGEELVRGVSFDVKRGEHLIITGPSGSGKSTVLRALGGIAEPTSGQVNVLGEDLHGMSKRRRERFVRDHIRNGVQHPKLDTNLSVRENLAGPAKMSGRYSVERLAQVAVRFGLGDKMDQSAASLSGGEQQRVLLGRVLLPGVDLILLDETTANIDPIGKGQLMEELNRFREDDSTTFVTVTHDVEAARPFADRELVIVSGQITNEINHT